MLFIYLLVNSRDDTFVADCCDDGLEEVCNSKRTYMPVKTIQTRPMLSYQMYRFVKAKEET